MNENENQNQNQNQNQPPSTSQTIFAALASQFASPSFLSLTSSQQQQLGSLLLGAILLGHLAYDHPATSSTLSTLIQAVGTRLSIEVPAVRTIVIAIAREVSKLITPGKHYDWPMIDITEIEQCVEEIRNHLDIEGEKDYDENGQENDENDMEKKKEKKEETGVQAMSQSIVSIYLNMDETVDIFAEEEERLIQEHLPEEEREGEGEEGKKTIHHHSSSLSSSFSSSKNNTMGNDDDDDDDDDEFIPYDLTEEPTESTHEFYHLEDAVDGLLKEDAYQRISAWKSILQLVKEDMSWCEDVIAIKKIMTTLLELNGLTGVETIWEEWQQVLAILIFNQSESAMTVLFEYLRENGRNNLTTVKCLAILQAVTSAGKMLFAGRMEIDE